ncbi:MAG TPA: PDZ domain-containing protein [Tepidisphaeraceae bacterium]
MPWVFAMLFLILLPLVSLAASIDIPATLQNLNNPDPAIRDQARQDLMAIHRSQLDDLRQAAIRAMPLSPEQIASLHEIVMQVILADAAHQADATSQRGFLGASPMVQQITGPDNKPRMAILITQRIPGFDAYRLLRNGDIILSIDGDPNTTRDIQTFMATIQTHAPGQQLRLQVLRDQQKIDITLELTARPMSADNLQPLDLFQTQQDRVEQYWRSNFASILKPAH